MQCLEGLVLNLASGRGKVIETEIKALSLSLKWKPMGIVGVNARPSCMSTSLMFEVNGRAVSFAPLGLVMVVLVRSARSGLMPASSGISDNQL